jgi:ubiquinone/menaquinone biosynthesis C-methylase UbiE
MTDTATRSREHFSRTASHYTNAALFANPEGLQTLIDAADPRPTDRVLDIATGTGHVALAFAPHVATVVASDITPAMLREAQAVAAERRLHNVVFALAPADALPFADGSFEIVTCRSAPHHFPDVGQFARECARVLAPGGRLVVMDTGSPEDAETDAWLDRVERLRDASHVRNYNVSEWRGFLEGAGLEVETLQLLDQESAWRLELDDWTRRGHTLEDRKAEIVRMFETAAEGPRRAFRVAREPGGWHFDIPRIFLVARKR